MCTHPGQQVTKIKKYPMFVSKPFKIETKSNSNQPQIYPIDKMHWKGPKSWPKEMCDHATHPRTQSASSFIAPAPDRKPQEAPEGPRRAPESFRRPQEAPGTLRRAQEAQERPHKTPGATRTAKESHRRFEEGLERRKEA